MLIVRNLPPFFDEPCTHTELDRAYREPPAALRREVHHDRSRVDRFVPATFLMEAARLPVLAILTRAAAMRYRVDAGISGPADSTVAATAIAQLAVTGARAWSSFQELQPQDATIMNTTRSTLQNDLAIRARDDLLRSSVAAVLDDAYKAAWALRGPPATREELRHDLGWMAVCAEVDSPHRPVNVPSAPYPQLDINLPGFRSGIRCRYMVAGRETAPGAPYPGPGTRILPAEPRAPSIPEGARIVLFVHGHGSRLEEALPLVPWILDIGANSDENFVVVSVDLPGRGYSTMLSHEVAMDLPNEFRERIPNWPADRRYPMLEFYERAIGAFLFELGERVGRRLDNLTIVGGSLGGNLCMRLANAIGFADMPAEHRQFFRDAVYVAWSPASVWQSFVRGHDHLKNETLRQLRDRMWSKDDADADGVRNDFFNKVYYEPTAGAGGAGLPPYSTNAGMWYRGGDWEACKRIIIEADSYETLEVYSELYRSWHWRVALEQLIFSHHDRHGGALGDSGPPTYTEIDRPLVLLAGEHDNYLYAQIYDATLEIAEALVTKPTGVGLFLRDTGHSIQAERPRLLANRIVDYTLDPH
jgi:pimeloyl-ACP methyl ester carboxylesterase